MTTISEMILRLPREERAALSEALLESLKPAHIITRVRFKSSTSSCVRVVEYDVRARELTVEFYTGTRYVYDDVEPDLVAEFVTCSSPGLFYNYRIKGAYLFRKLPSQDVIY